MKKVRILKTLVSLVSGESIKINAICNYNMNTRTVEHPEIANFWFPVRSGDYTFDLNTPKTRKPQRHTYFLFSNQAKQQEAKDFLLAINTSFQANLSYPFWVRTTASIANNKHLDLYLNYDNCFSRI